MPTYEYHCTKCDRTFERFQSMTEAPLKTCPFDGCKGKVRRLVSVGGGVIFKGSGFYATDYRGKSPQASSSEAKPACPAAGTKSCSNSSCPAAADD